MSDCDFTIGTFTRNILTVSDYYSSNLIGGYDTPNLDVSIGGINNIVTYAGFRNATNSVMSFTRLLDSGDEVADNALNYNSLFHVIWAYGLTDSFGYHGKVRRGSYLINFLSGQAIPCPNC